MGPRNHEMSANLAKVTRIFHASYDTYYKYHNNRECNKILEKEVKRGPEMSADTAKIAKVTRCMPVELIFNKNRYNWSLVCASFLKHPLQMSQKAKE